MHLTSPGTLSTINRFPEPWIPRVLQHLLETVLMTVTSETFEINAEVVSCGSVFILPSFGDIYLLRISPRTQGRFQDQRPRKQTDYLGG